MPGVEGLVIPSENPRMYRGCVRRSLPGGTLRGGGQDSQVHGVVIAYHCVHFALGFVMDFPQSS